MSLGSSGLYNYTNSFNSVTSLNNNSKFLSYESWNLPSTMKGLYSYLSYAYLTDSNVHPVIENITLFPITQVQIIDEPDADIKRMWLTILHEHLNVRRFSMEFGLDRNLYGTSAGSLYIPFYRVYTCETCSTPHTSINKNINWDIVDYQIHIECKSCKKYQPATIKDIPKKNSLKEFSLIRWNLFDIDLKKHYFTGKTTVYAKLHKELKDDIQTINKKNLETVPKEFILQALMFLRGEGPDKVELEDSQVFFSQRSVASMPSKELMLWGMPSAICSLRDIMYKNTMIRAQSTILHEHIIPFRIFYPEAASQDRLNIDMGRWKTEFLANYRAWLKDPSHIMTAPNPTGMVQVGGQGKILTLFPEIAETDKSIIKGLNVTRDFVEGGMTYSGASVTARMLENVLMNYMYDLNHMLNKIVDVISTITGLKKVKVRFKPFRMADDIQAKQVLINLYQIGVISAQTLLDAFDMDYSTESDIIIKEKKAVALRDALINTEVQVKSNKLQNAMMQTLPNTLSQTTNIVPPEQVTQLNQQLSQLDPEKQQQVLNTIAKQNPVLFKFLQDRNEFNPQEGANVLAQLQSYPPELQDMYMRDMEYNNPKKAISLKNVVDMRPMPEQKPPRRVVAV